MIVRLTQLDGKLPNLALMRLAAWHLHQGDDVRWQRSIARQLDEPDYDAVYGSAIFETSAKKVAMFREQWPGAIVGGSGGDPDLRVEDIVPSQFVGLDYSAYPKFHASIGYAMRGCRFLCDHCVVPKQEGRPRSAATIDQIWRGPGFPKHLHLLDNDFFGNPEWRDRVREIVDGGYKVCLNQGVTARVMNDEQAAAVVKMHPWDDDFKRARLYVAWDIQDQERVFLRGIDALERAGWKPGWCFAYMLIGFAEDETWEQIFHRYDTMVARGIRPYPMVHGRSFDKDPALWRKLKHFQGWAINGGRANGPFEQWNPTHRKPQGTPLLDTLA